MIGHDDGKRRQEGLLLSVLALAVLTVLSLYRGFGMVNDWKYTHFLFSYQDEFLKRSLVGELMRHLVGPVTYDAVVVCSVIALATLSVLLFYVCVRPALKKPMPRGGFLFAAVALSSPATLQHFAFDLGRFDVFNLLLAVASLLAIHGLSRMAAALVVCVLLAISLLIHEGVFFMYMPLVVGYWFYRDRARSALWLQGTYVVLAFLMTFVISRWGQVTLYSLDHHLALLTERFGDRVVAISVQVLHEGGVIQNIRRTYYLGVSMERLWHHLLMFVLLAPVLFMLFQATRAVLGQREPRAWLVLLAALSPLALYPLGHDHFRWWALALTNLFVALAMLGITREGMRTAIARTFERYWLLGWVAIGLALITGPLGVTESFKGPASLWMP